MASIVPVSKENHASKRWVAYSSYAFAANDAVIPLVMQELPRACAALPIGFAKVDEAYVLVAVQGLVPGKNLWVAPDGRWLGQYVPAAYRSWPFVLADSTDGQKILCVREESVSEGEEGEAFFASDGKPSQRVNDVLEFLRQIHQDKLTTEGLVQVVQEKNLIAPWPLTVNTPEGSRNIEGLYKVDETLLSTLNDEDFLSLRKAGALPLIYCQLLSMQHIQRLGELARLHAQQDPAVETGKNGDLDLEFLNDSDTIRFN